MGAIETLIMRCAALESILESDEPMLYQTHLADALGVELEFLSMLTGCLHTRGSHPKCLPTL